VLNMSKVKLIPGAFALLAALKDRKNRISSAGTGRAPDPVFEMAKRMHPDRLHLVVAGVRNETDTVKTFVLKAADGEQLPVFQPGQYISVKLDIDGSKVSRAYTISSAPYEAEGENGIYEIAVRQKENGLVSNAVWNSYQAGTALDATGPHGDFYWNPLRDTKQIVAIAGGAGITPFRSMIRQYAKEDPDLSVTLLYGCKNDRDILFGRELDAIIQEHPDQFKRVNTFESCDAADMRRGFIDAQFILDNVENPESKTFFICGPAIMYRFLRKEFAKIGKLERKQMRYEVSGTPDDVCAYADFDASLKGKEFALKVIMDDEVHELTASATEPLLVAVERAGLILDSRCRSGECGICRSKLVSGDVFVLPDNDGRREADRDLGYIHPCSTYPLSDVVMIIPPAGAGQT